ncbi:MATH domain and coiled-coil domain-containing protein [Cardamine amara subsp. amara]|uniref:MATH domain and coiled-coil domain-containing protein n=1 Tax=Cardamine amara subsp. amara TaxID=228776 RepID=A0ABD1A400_CARAN
MENQVDNKFTWVIKDFCSLRSEIIYSGEFVIGGCKWRLMAYPWGDMEWNNGHNMSLYLYVAGSRYLPCGWIRHAKFNLKVVNQHSEKLSQQKGKTNVFDQKTFVSGFVSMISRSDLVHGDGFLVNGQIKIVVEIDLLEVIGKIDVSEGSIEEYEEESEKESEETGRPLKNMKLNNDGAVSNSDLHNETQQGKETMNVHGFHVLPSQVELVSRIFKKYPDFALGFRAKNQHLRTACMNTLLSLIETLCQSPQELSNEDLVEADNSLTHLKVSGFKVDWLETKLAEVKEKKVREQCGETRMQELEKELKEFKQKCLDCEALLVKEKAQVSAARASLTLDDFV